MGSEITIDSEPVPPKVIEYWRGRYRLLRQHNSEEQSRPWLRDPFLQERLQIAWIEISRGCGSAAPFELISTKDSVRLRYDIHPLR
jgi:hypothetical protein